MASFLYRLGGLLVVVDVVYLTVWQIWRGGVDTRRFQGLLAASAICFAGGLVVTIFGRARSGIRAKSCPRCGRRVARGRMYCEDHLVETINRYRDEQRLKGD